MALGTDGNCQEPGGRACGLLSFLLVALLAAFAGAAGAGANRLRPPRRRLPQFPDPQRRSGRLRRALRARRALPRLELFLSAHGRAARHLLAEEQSAAARRGQMLRVGRARRRRDRAARAGRSNISIDRFGGDYRNFDTTPDSAGRCLQDRPARATTAAAPGPMRGPAISASRARCYLKEQDQAAAPQAVLHFGRGAVAS